METSPERAAYLEACTHLVEGRPARALELLIKLPLPVAEQPEVRLALARCYAALDRKNAAFRIVSALQAAHGPGPWTAFLQELFEQPTPAPILEPPNNESEAASGGRWRFRLVVAGLLLVFVLGVAGYFWGQEPEPVSEEEESLSWEPTIIERPLEPLDLLARMNDPKRVPAIFYALAPDVSARDVPALNLVLVDGKSPVARYSAAQLLGAVGDVSGLDALANAAESDADAYVRRAATYELRNFPHERAYRTLGNLLANDPLRDVRLLAAGGLLKLKGRGANALLQEALANEGGVYGRIVLERMLAPENRGTRPPLVIPGEVSAGVFRDTQYLVYTPASYREGQQCGTLLALHAEQGDSEALISAVKEAAEAHGCVAIAPFFDYANFDDYLNLNLAPSHMPVDLRLLDIVSAVGERVNIDRENLYLYGFGDGGAVAVRFALAHPARVKRVAVYRAENFVFPERTVLFPVGTRTHPLRPDLAPFDYANVVEKPIAILVGEDEDVDVLRATRRFVTAAQTYADANGLVCRVERHPIAESHMNATEAFAHLETFLLGGVE